MRTGIMAFMKKHEEYDWLNDPFDEKKAAEELQQAQMSGCSRLGVLVALLLVVVLVVVVAVVACGAFSLGSGLGR